MGVIELARITKTFTIDESIVKRLKLESNQSKLIENLLIEHFGGSDKEINAIKKQITDLQKKLEKLTEVRNGLKKIEEEKENREKEIVVKEEYEKKLFEELFEQSKINRDLYNQAYLKHKHIKDKIKQYAARINEFNFLNK
jgi:vacuolar-type H+-ATPase subunit I/STV1